MHGDHLDNNRFLERENFEDENIDDLPVFDMAELERLCESAEQQQVRFVRIVDTTVASMGEIVAAAGKHNLGVHIERCVILEAQIDSVPMDMSVDFSVFRGKIQCEDVTLDGKLGFQASTFKQGADFAKAVFKEDVSFSGCAFHKDVSFSGATFEKLAAFRSSQFNGEVTFENASFEGLTDFRRSSFWKQATCKGAMFKKSVNLANSSFKEDLESADSNLSDMKTEDTSNFVFEQGPGPVDLGFGKNALRSDHPGGHERTLGKKTRKKASVRSFNRLFKGMEKQCSRRELLRGVFRFLPEDKKQ
jgi:hypothetical protein